MPLETLSALEAISRIGKMKEARWPTKPADASRMEPFASPRPQPSFSFVPGQKIFTVGSCFARNIEKYLELYQFVLPVLKIKEAAAHWHNDPINIINKYVPFAMLNEFRWALDPASPFPDPEGFLEEEAGRWIDPQLGVGGKGTSLEIARERRALVRAVHSDVASSDILIATLGLCEAWWDSKTGTYLNRMPPKFAVAKEPDRFFFHVLSQKDVIDCLETMHRLIKCAAPAIRFLLTVSPIPTAFTFRQQDALVANMYSKSTLRSALEEFKLRHDDVDYFPSYETVMLSERSPTWKGDRLHVADEVVGRIVSKVIETYSPGLAKADDKLMFIGNVRALFHQKRYDEVVQIGRESVGKTEAGTDLELVLLIASSYRMLKMSERAGEMYDLALRLSPSDETARVGLSIVRLAQNRPDDVVGLLENFESTKDAHNAHYTLSRAYRRLGRIDLCVAMLERTLAARPSHKFALSDLDELRDERLQA